MPSPLFRREFLQRAAVAGAGVLVNRSFAASPAARPAPLPAAYRHWQAQARRLLEPLVPLFQPGHASLPLPGPASANGVAADRLETFARPMLLAAHFLQSQSDAADPSDAILRERLAGWFRRGLVAGTTPGGPHSWGPDANYHQLHVEMGLVALTLQVAPTQLWEPLTGPEQDQVAGWLASARHSGYVDNNHYFMGIHLLEFLDRHGYGRPGDRARVDEYFARLERMHCGEGWFQDGINQAFDYYNAYAFNFYGLWWSRLHGDRDPMRARRWREWARQFLAGYQHFFAASGEHPAFGRSITYRFNSVAPFGLAVLLGCTDLPLGLVRRLCTRNLDFFLAQPVLSQRGTFTVGWIDRFEESAELYTGAGSPYWAAKGFSPLLLPPEHRFWHEPDVPLPSERGDGAYPLPAAGLLLRHTGGEVELLNAGSQVSHTNLRYGAWKWSKTAYRTNCAFTCSFPAQTTWSPDSALTMRLEDGRVFGRHSTVALEVTNTHVRYSWALGFAWRADGPPEQNHVGVDTCLWWNRGWLLQVHRFEAWQPIELRLGGYALPLPTSDGTRRIEGPAFGSWHTSSGGSLVQPLVGLPRREWDERLDEHSPRRHLAAPYHTTPIAASERVNGSGWLAAMVWTGHDVNEAQPWRLVRAAAGGWQLSHTHLGHWNPQHAFLPDLSP
ncbi:MAG: DUF2264 domain-containing protein [Opitutaceae bacterium]|nr:DUF2264 domain-containing protein [Opitutaceae bacterium]